MNTGQEINLPLSHSLPLLPDPKLPSNPTVEVVLDNLRKNIEEAKRLMLSAQASQKKYADQHRRDVTYEEGEQVMLSTKNLRSTGRASKFLSKFIGPYPILQVISPTAYKLKLPDQLRIHPTFHVSLLRKYVDGKIDFPDREENHRPEPEELESGEEAYEVEAIVKKKKKYNKWYYEIKWVGYPEWENTDKLCTDLKKELPELVRKWESQNKS